MAKQQMSLVGFMQAGSTTVYAGSWRHPATEHGFLDRQLLRQAGPDPRRGLLRHDVLRRPAGHARASTAGRWPTPSGSGPGR